MDILRAVLIGALPVGAFTFLTLQWLLASGRLDGFTDALDLRKKIRAQAKAARKARRNSGRSLVPEGTAGDFFHNRLLSFGGGFYGTMALLTYVLIELIEIWNFVLGLANPNTWINKLGLELLIDFIINTITNLVAAFIWFVTLPEMIYMDNGWMWLGAAYGGYIGGLEITRRWGDRIWRWLGRQSRVLWPR